MLDLSAYTDHETCIALVAHGCPEAYTAIAKSHIIGRSDLSVGTMLFMSFVSRMRGLHEGTVRELAAGNPHAVLPLTRAWAEVVALAIYVSKYPAYAETLIHGPRNGGPGLKSFQAIFAAIKDEAANMKAVYGQLSDYSHFGSTGVWNAHRLGEQGEVSWTDTPRWRDETEFRAACARAHEIAVAGQYYLDQLGLMLSPR
jgi:hypothetical protein